jgi:hypothetical protein
MDYIIIGFALVTLGPTLLYVAARVTLALGAGLVLALGHSTAWLLAALASLLDSHRRQPR